MGVRTRARERHQQRQARGDGLVGIDGVIRRQLRDDLGDAERIQQSRSAGRGRAAAARGRRSPRRAERVGEIAATRGRHPRAAARGKSVRRPRARTSSACPDRRRTTPAAWRRPGSSCSVAGKKCRDLLAEIGNALDRHAAGAHLGVRRKGVADSRAPVLACIRPAASSPSPTSAAPRSSIAVFLPFAIRRPRSSIGVRRDGRGPDIRRAAARRARPDSRRRRRAGSASRCRRAPTRAACTARAASPATSLALFDLVDPGRNRTGEAGDIGGQQRVILQMVGRVIADDVDDRRRRAAGVVQIGEAVGQPGPRCSSVAAGLPAMRP